MKKIKVFIPLIFAFSPLLSFAYSTIPGCTSPSGMSTLTGESCATAIIAPVIKVVAPDTAESLERGSTYVIKWTSDNSVKPDSLVNIEIIEDINPVRIGSFATVKSRDGVMNSYTWRIPLGTALGKQRIFIYYKDFNDSNNTAQCIGMNYLTEKCSSNKSSVPFSVIEMKPTVGTSVTLLSPNGREQITAGTFLKIHWKQVTPEPYPGNPGVQVFLVGVSGPWAGSKKLVADYVERFSDDRGASVYIDPSTPPGNYRIRIEDGQFSSIFDESDASITVVSGTKTAQFSLITPNGGEVWQNAKTHKLKWQVVPSQEKIKSISVSFYDENLTQYFYSRPGIPASTNNGVMDFTLPTGSSQLQPGKYKVAIGFNCAGWFAEYEAMRKGCALFGVSSKPFTITAADAQTKIPQLSVTEQTTTTTTETVPTVSAHPVAEPVSTPEPTKRGFWKSIACFFSGLFGGVCK